MTVMLLFQEIFQELLVQVMNGESLVESENLLI